MKNAVQAEEFEPPTFSLQSRTSPCAKPTRRSASGL